MNPADTDKFRLRAFVDRLVQLGECEINDRPTALIDVAKALDGNARATLFTSVGPEGAALVGNVMGSRRRLALALDTGEAGLGPTLLARLASPIPPVEVSRSQAPVQQVVLTGDEADLCALPVHLQHGLDGAPYISAGIDFAYFPGAAGRTNLGCRRIMLRGPRTAGIDLVAPSDLRAVYLEAAARNERLPVAYTVGAHPADFIAAVTAIADVDELAIMGGLRGAPVPVVKCVTSDIRVPADAEYVLEGYLDPAGHVEPEGPYGEYIGYYGTLKRNPVFHLTAITRRKDALFQTLTIGGRHLARTDTAQLTTVKAESAAWTALQTAIREPVQVYATPSSGGMYNIRIAMRQRYPGESRNAIAAVFGSKADVKHVFVFDDDIDVFSDEQVDWALATRFQGNRDLVVADGFRCVPLDPSLAGSRTGAKVGFDCTIPFGKKDAFEFSVPAPPVVPQRPRASVADVLAQGPATFLDLMAAAASSDGREILRELDRLYCADRLGRLDDGRYALKDGAGGARGGERQ